MIINSLRKENNQGKNYRKITTGDWVHEWFNNYAINPSDSKYVKGKLSKNTYTSERYRLKSVFDNEEFCNILIDEVSQSDIYQFVNSLKAKRKRRTNNVIKLRTIKQLEKGYYPEEYYEDDAPKNIYYGYTNNHLYDYDSLCTYYSRIKQISKNLEFNRDIYKANIKYLDKNTFFDDREDLSFKSKKNIVDLLRMAFRCAKNFEIIKNNPFEKFSFTDGAENIVLSKEALTEKERDIFLKAAESSKYFNAFLLMAFTGMRKGEVLGLKVKNINTDEKYIEVEQQLVFKRPKERTPYVELGPLKSMHSKRKIPITNQELLVVLTKLIENRDEDELLFSYIENDMIVAYHKIYREIKALFNICYLITGIKKYLKCSNHTLRHTYATIYLSKYPDCLVQISAILGHSNTAFTAKQYIHIETEKIDTSKLGERKIYDDTLIKTTMLQTTVNYDYMNELKSLKKLLDEEILTLDEFNLKKKEILKI